MGSNYLNPYTYTHYDGWGAVIRGGLHYLRQEVDASDEVTEGNEEDNRSVHMYVWDGVPLAKNVPQTWSAAPVRNPEGSTFYAMDGFSNGGNLMGYWEVYGVMPESTNDYDIYIFDEAPTSTSGFQYEEAVSSAQIAVDFVGANQHQAGVSTALWAGVLNFAGLNQDYTIEGDASTYLGGIPGSPELVASGSLDAGEVLDVYEFYGLAGEEAWMYFDVTNEIGYLSVRVFGPDHEYFSRYDIDGGFSAYSYGESVSGSFTVNTTGYHGIVLCRTRRDDLHHDIDFDFYLGTPAGDLVHHARDGWTHEVVARNTGVGSTGVLPVILNEGSSVVDNGLLNQGSGPFLQGSNNAFYLDGPLVHESGNFTSDIDPGEERQFSDIDLGYVTGGRHEVGAVIDLHEEVAEEPPQGEENNAYYTQYAWAPLELSHRTPLTRDPPPNRTNASHSFSLPGWNQDGYVFYTYYWTGVACMPHGSQDYYYTVGYDHHSTDPESALLNSTTLSGSFAGNTTFCMVNGSVVSNYLQRDFGVYNNLSWPSYPSISDYQVEACQKIHDCWADHPYGPYTMGSDHILHVYDLYVLSGEYPVALLNLSGADLDLAIFEAGLDYADHADALLMLDSGGPGSDESGTLTAAASGRYGLAVFKHGWEDRTIDAQYRFLVGERKPRPITDLEIIPVILDPYYYNYFDFQFSDVTQDIYGYPLEADYYSLYYSFDPYAEFPEDWAFYLNNTESEFLNVATLAQVNMFFLVTATDEDGFIVASSGGVEQPWSRGRTAGRWSRKACLV